MRQPTVSVIVPDHNYARTLGLCLESGAAQTYPHIETVIVDDGSTDPAAGMETIQAPPACPNPSGRPEHVQKGRAA